MIDINRVCSGITAKKTAVHPIYNPTVFSEGIFRINFFKVRLKKNLFSRQIQVTLKIRCERYRRRFFPYFCKIVSKFSTETSVLS
jgi:hypothetical protein